MTAFYQTTMLIYRHTTSVSYHFPNHGVLFTGDALVTADSMTGSLGPRTVSRAFTHDSARLVTAPDGRDRMHRRTEASGTCTTPRRVPSNGSAMLGTATLKRRRGGRG